MIPIATRVRVCVHMAKVGRCSEAQMLAGLPGLSATVIHRTLLLLLDLHCVKSSGHGARRHTKARPPRMFDLTDSGRAVAEGSGAMPVGARPARSHRDSDKPIHPPAHGHGSGIPRVRSVFDLGDYYGTDPGDSTP